jgi:hypothetical protein
MTCDNRTRLEVEHDAVVAQLSIAQDELADAIVERIAAENEAAKLRRQVTEIDTERAVAEARAEDERKRAEVMAHELEEKDALSARVEWLAEALRALLWHPTVQTAEVCHVCDELIDGDDPDESYGHALCCPAAGAEEVLDTLITTGPTPCPKCAAAEARAEEYLRQLKALDEYNDVYELSEALAQTEAHRDRLAEALRRHAVRWSADGRWRCGECGANGNGEPEVHAPGCLAALTDTPEPEGTHE